MNLDNPAANGHDLLQDYRAVLRALLDASPVSSVQSAHSIGSGWGTIDRGYREKIGLTFSVDTDEVLLSSADRPVSVDYAVVSSAWTVLGRNDLEPLARVNPRGSSFSVDGFTLSGAFGYRMRVASGDQIAKAVEMLRADPTSRRAVVFIGEPADLMQESRDFPCAASVQFFVRDSRLRSYVTMRSSSFFGVFPYDLVNFRYLQQYVAAELGLPPGVLDFACGSCHVYDEEVDRIEKFLAGEADFLALPEFDWATLDTSFSTWMAAAEPSLDIFTGEAR